MNKDQKPTQANQINRNLDDLYARILKRKEELEKDNQDLYNDEAFHEYLNSDKFKDFLENDRD